MPIPSTEALILPLLKITADGRIHETHETTEQLADELGLSKTERTQRTADETAQQINYNAAWAKTYLRKAGLIEERGYGKFQITNRGRELLATGPDKLDINALRQSPEFQKWRDTRKQDPPAEEVTGRRPKGREVAEVGLEEAHALLRQKLATEVLEKTRDGSPELFEKLVIDTLLAMGYGGSRAEAGKAIGKSGDEDIDGLIKQDRLGLDTVYVQAKRWTKRTIGRPDVQQFAGALQGKRARKGVFITTSTFSKDARDYADKIDSKVVLINGNELCGLMIDHGVGVTTDRTYEVKRIDADYFTEQ